jgi:hypothetical protein
MTTVDDQLNKYIEVVEQDVPSERLAKTLKKTAKVFNKMIENGEYDTNKICESLDSIDICQLTYEELDYLFNFIDDNAMIRIKLGGKRGGYAVVSLEDYDWLRKYNWWDNGKGYVKCKINGKPTMMHRLIMKSTDKDTVDHKNNIKFDNRRNNLENSTYLKNGQNKKISKNKRSSKYKGVNFEKIRKKYGVSVMLNYKRFYLGYFDNEIDAACAYDLFVVHNKLNHIGLNFPEKINEYLDVPYDLNKYNTSCESKYYGVYKTGDKYNAVIYLGVKTIQIKKSKNEIKCAKAYDKYIIDNNICRRKLNFPEDYPEYNKDKIKTLCEKNDNETVKILINNNKNNKYPVIIDKEDYDKIKYNRICVNDGYIKIYINSRLLSLHRYLMNVTDSKIFVDHINNNPFDNRKCNLRLSNAKLNSQNKVKKSGTLSKYLGVTFDKSCNKWKCSIMKNSKNVYTSNCDSERIAAIKRDLYILENLKDDNYKLNFEWTDEKIQKWKNKLNV